MTNADVSQRGAGSRPAIGQIFRGRSGTCPTLHMPLDLHSVQSRLPARQIEWHPTVTSTMTLAAELARVRSPQRHRSRRRRADCGRGPPGPHLELPRRHRPIRFHRPAPAACRGKRVPLVMLALGLAAKQAIEVLTSLAVDLRWPNDVLVDGQNAREFWRTGKATRSSRESAST